MRKKLFAVIMSVMMMVTFMPAMAFAATQFDADPAAASTAGNFVISGLSNGKVVTTDQTYFEGHFIYDGAEHTVTYTPSKSSFEWKYATYTVAYKPFGGTMQQPKEWNTQTAPAVKEAGQYLIRMTANCSPMFGQDYKFNKYLFLTIAQRPVSVTSNTLVKTVEYNGNQYALTDADLGISTFTGNIDEYTFGGFKWAYDLTWDPYWDAYVLDGPAQAKAVWNKSAYHETFAWNGNTVAWKAAHSGLVAGDKLLITEVKTQSADAGEYDIQMGRAAVNPNYFIASQTGGNFKVVITKAANEVKMSKTNKTYKAKTLKNSKQSFKINPKAKWGTPVVTKVGGSGWLYLNGNKVVVKKGCPKGTYHIQVRVSVVGTNNYNSAELTKTLNVKVR